MSLAVGFLTGIAASMGLGGGFILILYLTLFAGVPQLAAQGANLLFFLPIALFSVILHTRNGLVAWKKLPLAAGAGIVGAAVGTLVGAALDDAVLQKLFAGLLLLVALRELFHKKKAQEGDTSPEGDTPPEGGDPPSAHAFPKE
ncbi:MAG: sulfite exporter TauE/SafE family protein [Bacteroides sp.]|nr:sulfite exporter TauE/SafE family protein [Eubacterium sp.]MCM1417992.1 sulfite exporter TauE/SafE family protein [Roseburia sp.]MCM1462185.1 sulfite exporter TauE/SafE family protein [Bacteroides sp.]